MKHPQLNEFIVDIIFVVKTIKLKVSSRRTQTFKFNSNFQIFQYEITTIKIEIMKTLSLLIMRF